MHALGHLGDDAAASSSWQATGGPALSPTGSSSRKGHSTVRSSGWPSSNTLAYSTVSAAAMDHRGQDPQPDGTLELLLGHPMITFLVITAIPAPRSYISRLAHHGRPRSCYGWHDRWQAGPPTRPDLVPPRPILLRQLKGQPGTRSWLQPWCPPYCLSVCWACCWQKRHTWFDLLGWLLWPLTWLLDLGEPPATAKALCRSGRIIRPPSWDSGCRPAGARRGRGFWSARCSSSASIPCILATRIPGSVGQLVVIWLRTCLVSAGRLVRRAGAGLGWLGCGAHKKTKRHQALCFYQNCSSGGDDGEPLPRTIYAA